MTLSYRSDVSSISTCAISGLAICRVYATFSDPQSRLLSVDSLGISTNDPQGFYQVFPLSDVPPTTEFTIGPACDSFVTIGASFQPSCTQLAMDFDSLAFNTQGRITAGSTYFCNNDSSVDAVPATASNPPNDGSSLMIAQLTMRPGFTATGSMRITYSNNITGNIAHEQPFACFCVTETVAPTMAPTVSPTNAPTAAPTNAPTTAPTNAPTRLPTSSPTAAPTFAPTLAPTLAPTVAPTFAPTPPPLGQCSDIVAGLSSARGAGVGDFGSIPVGNATSFIVITEMINGAAALCLPYPASCLSITIVNEFGQLVAWTYSQPCVDGIYSLDWTPTVAGWHTVTVLVDGLRISTSPQSVYVRPCSKDPKVVYEDGPDTEIVFYFEDMLKGVAACPNCPSNSNSKRKK